MDCANGVGGPKLRALAEHLGPLLAVDLRNAGGSAEGGRAGGLNDQCGAEHLQKERTAPVGCGDVGSNTRCCSMHSVAHALGSSVDRLGELMPSTSRRKPFHQLAVGCGRPYQVLPIHALSAPLYD